MSPDADANFPVYARQSHPPWLSPRQCETTLVAISCGFRHSVRRSKNVDPFFDVQFWTNAVVPAEPEWYHDATSEHQYDGHNNQFGGNNGNHHLASDFPVLIPLLSTPSLMTDTTSDSHSPPAYGQSSARTVRKAREVRFTPAPTDRLGNLVHIAAALEAAEALLSMAGSRESVSSAAGASTRSSLKETKLFSYMRHKCDILLLTILEAVEALLFMAGSESRESASLYSSAATFPALGSVQSTQEVPRRHCIQHGPQSSPSLSHPSKKFVAFDAISSDDPGPSVVIVLFRWDPHLQPFQQPQSCSTDTYYFPNPCTMPRTFTDKTSHFRAFACISDRSQKWLHLWSWRSSTSTARCCRVNKDEGARLTLSRGQSCNARFDNTPTHASALKLESLINEDKNRKREMKFKEDKREREDREIQWVTANNTYADIGSGIIHGARDQGLQAVFATAYEP
ncbi:hypothetical protein FISHEDRAFT_73208 [Fistulina hepatica ATCC 64428]|uniref:Uncharacterized protein n=1 Tax=Fistulina hepatica ATCC 64428 TaxID=1128425 RepID=A0A0D7AEP0_9AGAR|nr:hypothetical protein FISHEDRAFT_73208 [Fistulina hepatica ATCC 64428]